MNEVRIDKWLWAVRIYRTRTLAAEACRAGHVRMGGHVVKASRSVKVGDSISVQMEQITRTFRVLEVLERRVGAPRVVEFMEDLTPAAEYAKLQEIRKAELATASSRSLGRPSKKDRRALEEFWRQP